MTKLSVECIIDNHQVGTQVLNALEFERTQHVLHEMKSLGADVQQDEHQLTHADINLLGVKTARDVNIETRAQYSATEIQAMYRPQIKMMEDMWKKICKGFNLAKSPFKMSQTYMKVLGVDPDLIINGRPQKTVKDETPEDKMRRIANEASEMALQMNPEHFFVTASDDGLYGMETFGMYGAPYPQLITPLSTDALPVPRDPAYPVATTGQPTLMDGTPLYTIPYHQYKPLENGIELKLSVIMPETTPDEIINGHAYHLAIEFMHTAEIYAQSND
ncbi:hypothetical protein [Loigolactobacillus bifermentans]|uniref:Uncharacterized protein n=1 Tax=Loigolactobacillus bifermentans DSM 20003 TaxID=1423726 RepID=A0A0R1GNM5_9LACO|nr:hypothetical protein [Loigolactobacillus bifermentans]KRK35544.1 hypothetical protein FC07_GL000100 [Loigolactobacillus bifermentans DSM 20003]QGG59870.1 hypothetical protein LB003_05020 [Loigolactobacillus bifermentans]